MAKKAQVPQNPPGNGFSLFPEWVNNEQTLQKFTTTVDNILMMRSEIIKKFIDPRRSIEDECGYPSEDWDSERYQELYDRDAIAVRVVQVLPKECWQVQPVVYEDENNDVETAFELGMRLLGHSLHGASFYRGANQSTVWEYLRRVDEQSGIGQFGVLLYGIRDGKSLEEPATFYLDGKADELVSLDYIRVFPESKAKISSFVTDRGSPRYGQPEYYSLALSDVREASITESMDVRVHWSRILHVADNLDDSEWFGAPRMRPVLNRLLDLAKLYGGSAEMYWRGAFPGISLESHPQLSPRDTTLDEGALRNMMENYSNGLQRYLALVGMSAKSLAPQVVDPTPQIRVQIEAICIRLGVPKRIFMGSERGELASVQDDKTWNDRLRERQANYLTPRVIIPFVDRLILLGVLPRPLQGYDVYWPDITFQTEADRVRVAIIKTEALSRFLETVPNPMLTELDYLITFLNVPEKEAKTMLANAKTKFQELGIDYKTALTLQFMQKMGLDVQSEEEDAGEPLVTEGKNGDSTKDLRPAPAPSTGRKGGRPRGRGTGGNSPGLYFKKSTGEIVIDPDSKIRLPGMGEIKVRE